GNEKQHHFSKRSEPAESNLASAAPEISADPAHAIDEAETNGANNRIGDHNRQPAAPGGEEGAEDKHATLDKIDVSQPAHVFGGHDKQPVATLDRENDQPHAEQHAVKGRPVE